MKFEYVTLNGSRGWTAHFTRYDTVASLKKDLEMTLKTPKNNLTVFYKNHLLEEMYQLGKYNMICGETIEVFIISNQLNIVSVAPIEPIPEIETGAMCSFGDQLIQSGIHMEPDARIIRNSKGFAVSILVSNKYDIDLGHEIIFCGSEGKNKFGDQVADQELSGRKESLVKNFASNNWRAGIAIRVIRELEIKEKNSKTGLPTKCYRYDGYYKVKNYWAEKIDEFVVWRFHLVRDDTRPIKWSNHLSIHEDTEENEGVGRLPAIESVPINSIVQLQVGTIWIYRADISKAGIHTDMVAGISTNKAGLARSIILSGTYEDDDDQGDDVYYTGSGSRDNKGNPTKDQELIRKNLALAKTCEKFSPEGAETENWKSSEPIMVIRKLSLANSPYRRTEFFRYDGIYKLAKFWKQSRSNSFRVWRFHLKRHDAAPAPWSK